MTFQRLRRPFVVLASLALIGSGTLLAPTGIGGVGVASAECPAIEVIFARGTNDTPGLGRVGDAFVDQLRNKVGGRSVGSYAVNYPASYDFLAAAGGANDASAHVQFMMDNCPGTRLVLGGYSQGAAVIDVIAAVPFPAIGFNNPLPPNAADFIAGIAAFGNPSAKAGLPLTASPVYGARSIDLCNPGDAVCQTNGQNVATHSAYAGGPTNTAANFIAGLL